jgi:hypothetical protein
MYKTQRYNTQTLVPVAGARTTVRLQNKVQTRFIQLWNQALVTIGTAFTSLLNGGSSWAIYDFLGILENGKERVLLDGPTLRFISNLLSAQQIPEQLLAGVGVQTNTPVSGVLRIPFSFPLAANPGETVFVERDQNQVVEVFANLRADGGIGGLGFGGGGAGSIPSASLQVLQGSDKLSSHKPLFIPTIRQISTPIPQAGTYPIYLRASWPLRAIVIKQTSDQGEISDLVVSAVIRSDYRDIIGPNPVPWQQLIQGQQQDFAGFMARGAPVVAYGNSAYYGHVFQEGGRLSNVLDAPREPNLRVEVTTQAPAEAGVTNPRIVITLLELEREDGVTADQIPFTI